MNWSKYTLVFISSVIGCIFIYDVVAIYNGGTEASISHMIIGWSYKYPAFTFLMGFTMGHLFWRMKQTKSMDKIEGGE